MSPLRRTVLDDIHVFDGSSFSSACSVTIEGDSIVSISDGPQPGDQVVDGAGRFLLPGFIEGHAHVTGHAALQGFARWGVTTVLDMGNKDPDTVRALRTGRESAAPDILLAGLPASAAGGMHVKKEGFPSRSIVTGPPDAARFVAEQVAEGVDYIKVIVEDPKMPGTEALTNETVAAIVEAAHAADRRVVAHAVTATAVMNAGEAGVDIVTHAPLDRPLEPEQASALAARGTVLMPTLVMMRDVAASLMSRLPLRILAGLRIAPRLDVANATQTVRAWRGAGGTVIVGTDANETPFAPAHPSFGTSFHDELELLAQAGLAPLEILNAATAGNALAFGLTDRGAVTPGCRADLIILERDPSSDITASRDIGACWIGGVQIECG